jgi:hypothetical protein
MAGPTSHRIGGILLFRALARANLMATSDSSADVEEFGFTGRRLAIRSLLAPFGEDC